MNLIKRLIAGLLNFIVVSVLLVGSCAGPVIMYYQSPRWLLEDISPDNKKIFFVAFIADDIDGTRQLQVLPQGVSPEQQGYSNIQYHIPEGEQSYSHRAGEGSATITAKTEDQGSQLIQVFVVGDTLWSSLSEYRVEDNKIYPLRYAESAAWLLLGIIVCLFVLNRLLKPIDRGIKRLIQVEPEK